MLSNLMSIARNSSLIVGLQVLGLVGGLVTSVMTARFLGPTGRGQLVLVNFSLMVVSLMAGLGLNQSLLYMLGKGRLDRRQALGLISVLSLVLGASFLGVSAAAYALLRSSVLTGVTPFAYLAGLLALPAMLFIDWWSHMNIAANRFRPYVTVQSGITLINVVAAIFILWVYRQGAAVYLLAMSAGYWSLAIGAFVTSVRQDGMTLRVPRERIVEMVRYGLAAYTGSLVNAVYLRLDAFLLNLFAGTSHVGVYSVAVTLNERIWNLDAAVSQAVLPHVVRQTHDEAARLTALTARTLVILAAMIGAVLALAAPWLIPFLFGAEFAGAVPPLLILLPGTILFSAGRAYSNFLSGQMGRPALSSLVAVATALVSIPAYLILIPAAGVNGAALGSTLTYAFGFLFALGLFVRHSGMSLGRTLAVTREDISVYRGVLGRIRGIRRSRD